jgi:hypothetical protein
MGFAHPGRRVLPRGLAGYRVAPADWRPTAVARRADGGDGKAAGSPPPSVICGRASLRYHRASPRKRPRENTRAAPLAPRRRIRRHGHRTGAARGLDRRGALARSPRRPEIPPHQILDLIVRNPRRPGARRDGPPLSLMPDNDQGTAPLRHVVDRFGHPDLVGPVERLAERDQPARPGATAGSSSARARIQVMFAMSRSRAARRPSAIIVRLGAAGEQERLPRPDPPSARTAMRAAAQRPCSVTAENNARS